MLGAYRTGRVGREEKKVDEWPIHSQCRHVWIITEDTDLCNLDVLVVIITKRKYVKQLTLCFKKKKENLSSSH